MKVFFKSLKELAEYKGDFWFESLDEYQANLSALDNKMAILQEKAKKLMSLKNNQDTLSDTEFFRIANEFYDICWETSRYEYISDIKKDKDLEQFLKILINYKKYGKKRIDTKDLGICRQSSGSFVIEHDNTTFNRFTMFFTLGKKHYRKSFARDELSECMTAGLCQYKGRCMPMPEDIPILYIPKLNDRGDRIEINHFNISSSGTQRDIFKGIIIVLSFPDILNFPLQYCIVKDLEENCLNCINYWLNKDQLPEDELNEYQIQVLNALKTYLIPLLKEKINNRLDKDIEYTLKAQESLKPSYNHLLKSFKTQLDYRTKALNDEIKRKM